MKTIKTVDLVSNIKQVCDWLEKNKKEWITISRPHNKNMVIMTEEEANALAKARRNAEYLSMLDKSVEEAKNGGAYQYLGKGKFIETPQKVEI